MSAANTPSTQSQQLRGPLVDKDGNANYPFLQWLYDIDARLLNTMTRLGEIAAATKIQGRSEGVGTTVVNLTPTGKVNSTDNVIDGTGSPLTGGKRGFVALDTNNRLADSFRSNPVNVSSVPLEASVLSNDGVSTVIPIAANNQQFGPGTKAYSPGSFDPGGFGTFVAWVDDPTFAGGAIPYQFSTNITDQTANDGRIPVGAITSAFGVAHTGGGNTGGDTPGGGGGRGYNKF